MAEKVKLSKDGSSIDFVQTDNIPTSMKKFRQSPEIEGFYRFIYENDLQKEAFEILERIVTQRKVAKKALKQEAAQTKKLELAQEKAAAAEATMAKMPKPKKDASLVADKKVAKAKEVKAAKPAAKAKVVAKPAAKAKSPAKATSKAKPTKKSKK